MWRCLNDKFGYCSEEPEPKSGGEELIKSGDIGITTNTCKLSPKTCNKFQVLSEQLDPEKLAQLTDSIHQTTTFAKIEAEVTKNKKKPAAKGQQEETLF